MALTGLNRACTSLIILALVAVAGASATCQAAITGGYVSLSQPKATVYGGEFDVHNWANASGGSELGGGFKVFCLEVSEHINLGTRYKVDDFTGVVAKKGGIDRNGTGNLAAPDPSPTGEDNISKGTQWLYERFLADYGIKPGLVLGEKLSDVDLGGGVHFDKNSAQWSLGLQAAIWRLEDEVYRTVVSGVVKYKAMDSQFTSYDLSQSSGAKADLLYNYVTTHYASWQANAAAGSFVTVLNISGTDSKHTLAQSQLAYNPNGEYQTQDEPVPEPATLATWGGMATIGLLFSRLRNRK